MQSSLSEFKKSFVASNKYQFDEIPDEVDESDDYKEDAFEAESKHDHSVTQSGRLPPLSASYHPANTGRSLSQSLQDSSQKFGNSTKKSKELQDSIKKKTFNVEDSQ